MQSLSKTERYNYGEWAILVFLLLGIMPAARIAGYVTPLQYLLLPLLSLVLLAACCRRLAWPEQSRMILWLCVVITLEVLFTSIVAPIIHFGSPGLPSEVMQYFARFVTLFAFIILYYNYEFSGMKFIFGILAVLFVAMLIGLIQWFDWSGNYFLWEQYTYSDRYLSHFERSMVTRRVPGVAQMPTANGGLAAFTFSLALAAFYFLKRYRIFIGLLMILAVINTIASQARMGYLTIFFSLIVFYFFWIYFSGNVRKPTFILFSLVSSLAIMIRILYIEESPFIYIAMVRWGSLFEQIIEGGNRLGQVLLALSIQENLFDYLFGISRVVQTQTPGLRIEIEPVNILVLYGFVGFILQYGLVLLLLLYFLKQVKVVRQEPVLLTLVIASFVSLLGYQFFSISYYFFREVYVGLFPWIIMGVTIGLVEKYKRGRDPAREIQEQPRT